jgi:hypothetical protein
MSHEARFSVLQHIHAPFQIHPDVVVSSTACELMELTTHHPPSEGNSNRFADFATKTQLFLASPY